jgi:energy-coupling factor transport system ATP-binding protein
VGLMAPTRGRIERTGPARLLLQNPNDYLVHETVAAEASPESLKVVGLDPESFGSRHPRELSVGEKQLLALAVVLGDSEAIALKSEVPPHVDPEPLMLLCLDEPTRGLDRRRKAELAGLLGRLEAAVLVATHDPEFVAAFAERVVLLGQGEVLADGPVSDVLASGTYFATETARILGGAGGALTPEQGAALLRAGVPAPADPVPVLVEVPR